MPVPKNASTASHGAKNKTASSSGTATPVSWAEKDTLDVSIATLAGGKPDKKAYDAQQDAIKKEIDALQVKLVRLSIATIVSRLGLTQVCRVPFAIKSRLRLATLGLVMTDELSCVTSSMPFEGNSRKASCPEAKSSIN